VNDLFQQQEPGPLGQVIDDRLRLGSCVSKITKPKHQIPNKSQIPNSKPVQSDFFCFGF
jgi:hypothetical protein